MCKAQLVNLNETFAQLMHLLVKETKIRMVYIRWFYFASSVISVHASMRAQHAVGYVFKSSLRSFSL